MRMTTPGIKASRNTPDMRESIMAASVPREIDGQARKRKRSEDDDKLESDAVKNFDGFTVTRVLNKKMSSKSIFVLGTFGRGRETADIPLPSVTVSGDSAVSIPGDAGPKSSDMVDDDSKKHAVVLLEKTAFTEECLPALMSGDTSLNRVLQNDIYGSYECFPRKELCGIKATVIYPATEKHIQKYSAQELHLINETGQEYKDITLPYLEESQFNIQWVFNILDKKAEADRIVLEDPHPETGFVMLPDMKWDGKQTSNLYLIVIVHPRGIKSLRDLDATHLPLLRNIQEKCTEFIKERYSIQRDQLRAYIHYQPSYYHLHVHFTHLQFDAPGTNVGRAHLLSSVIENIEMVPDYYQRIALPYVLRVNDELLKRFRGMREKSVT